MVQGILCVAGASLLFGLIPSANKFVMLAGVPPECVTFLSHGTVFLMAALLAKCTGNSLRIPRRQILCLLLLGAVGMGGTSFLINSASARIPVGVTTVLHFLYPTIVSLVMVTVFHQRMSWYKAAAMVCSIVGMLLITDLRGDSGLSVIGILLALCSSLTYSFYMISNEKGSINAFPLVVKLTYASLGSTLAFGTIAVCTGRVGLPATAASAAVLVGISGFGSLSAFYLITAGIRRIGASVASFVNMLEPIVSVVVSAVVYQETPTLAMALGMCLVLSAVWLIAMDGRRSVLMADQSFNIN